MSDHFHRERLIESVVLHVMYSCPLYCTAGAFDFGENKGGVTLIHANVHTGTSNVIVTISFPVHSFVSSSLDFSKSLIPWRPDRDSPD